MKRTRFLTSATAVLLALCLTACGEAGTVTTTGSSRSTSASQTVSESDKTSASTPVTSEKAPPVTTSDGESSDKTSLPTPGTTASKPVTSDPGTKPVTTGNTPVTTVSTPVSSDKPKPPDTTTSSKKPITTSTPVTSQKPNVQTPAVGTSITVRYYVNNSSAGTLTGSTTQTIRYGQTKTSAVTAIAKLGYKFTGWSDGVKTASRSAESFTSNQSLTANFELDGLELPILYLTTKDGVAITSKDVYVEGTISVYNTDSKYMFENLAMEIRGRGNYTWGSQAPNGKVPYKIKLSEKKNLLGEGNGAAKTWTLIADHCDQALLRNYTALNFARNMKYITWNSAAQSVEVYLNGEYRGVFLLCEQNQVNKNRVNINDDIEAQPDQRGYLIEMSGYASEQRFTIWGWNYNGPAYEVKSDLSTNSNLANRQMDYINDYLQQCWDAVESGNQANIEKLMDINSVIDCLIVEELFKNLDAGWDSFYMYKDKGGKLVFGPIWDFDQTGGNADEGCENYYDLRGSQTNAWFRVLLQNSWFKEKLTARWNEVKSDADKIPASIRTQAKAGYNSYCRNFERWPIFGQKINRETQVIRNLKSYTEHYEYYANWMKNRIDWLDDYWNSPTFNFSGKLTLKGSGTAASPYLVSSAADFQNFTACVLSGQNFSGKYFRQTADIDMSSTKGYTGMGSSCTFAGIYDGQGHTIKVNISASDNSIFPYLTGTIYNVVATGNITNSGISAGLCRSVRSGGVLINCVSLVNVVSTDGNAAGITASNQNGAVIANCFFGGTISAPNSTGPINIWYGDRSGTFLTNYYLEGTPYDNGEKGWLETGETAIQKTQSAANTAIAALNNGKNAAATAGSVRSSALCDWIVKDNMPTLKAK